jgi:hypothetical protein
METIMSHRSTCVFYVALALGLATACADKAQPDYARCVQADTSGDLDAAWKACNDAIGADPASASGKAAAAKMAEMKPKYDKWREEQAQKAEAAAKIERAAAIERAQADEVARARAAAELRRKVRPAGDNEPDGECQAKGMPPYRNDYRGGTYEENEQVALADGCVHLFERHMDRSPNDNTFCCPK